MYEAPLARGVAKVKLPFAFTARLSPPLFWTTRLSPAARPLTEPPTVNVAVVQATAILVTSALATTPEPAETVHDCDGELGFVTTVAL